MKSSLFKHLTRKRKRSKENDTTQSNYNDNSNDSNNHVDTVTMTSKGEHSLAYERLRETNYARVEMERTMQSERHQHELNLSQVTEELVAAKQENMKWTNQLQTYQEGYKRWNKKVLVWIAQQKRKACSDCQQLKAFESDHPVSSHRKPFNDLTNHCSISGIKATVTVTATATVTPSNGIKKTHWSPARSPMSSQPHPPEWSPMRSPARLPTVKENIPHVNNPTQLKKSNALQILEVDSEDQSQALLNPKHTSSLQNPRVRTKKSPWTTKVKSERSVWQNSATTSQSPNAMFVGNPSSTTKIKGKHPIAKDPRAFVCEGKVRKKAERQKMQGHACPECKAYWDAVCGDGSVFKRNHFEDFSRHRAHQHRSSSPEHFWVLSFTDEME